MAIEPKINPQGLSEEELTQKNNEQRKERFIYYL